MKPGRRETPFSPYVSAMASSALRLPLKYPLSTKSAWHMHPIQAKTHPALAGSIPREACTPFQEGYATAAKYSSLCISTSPVPGGQQQPWSCLGLLHTEARIAWQTPDGAEGTAAATSWRRAAAFMPLSSTEQAAGATGAQLLQTWEPVVMHADEGTARHSCSRGLADDSHIGLPVDLQPTNAAAESECACNCLPGWHAACRSCSCQRLRLCVPCGISHSSAAHQKVTAMLWRCVHAG